MSGDIPRDFTYMMTLFLFEYIQIVTPTSANTTNLQIWFGDIPSCSREEHDGVLLNFKLSELVKTLGQFFRKKYKEVSAEFYFKTK